MNEPNDIFAPGFIHRQISELKKQKLIPSHILLGRIQVEALVLALNRFPTTMCLENRPNKLFGFEVVEADTEDLIQVVSKEYFDHLEERTVVE